MESITRLVAAARHRAFLTWVTGLCLLLLSWGGMAAPATFEQAKVELRQHVYFDQHKQGALGSLYCGCSWEWRGVSGGRVNFASCGYRVRAQQHRAVRIEHEHIVSAWLFGQQRRCWQEGGRAHCVRTDPAFSRMEADMHNLSPTVGEINADRSNFRFGVLPHAPLQHGACDFRVDFQARVAEPRDAVKGLVARVNFYMHDRYGLIMSQQQERLFMAWDRQFPVSAWELERDRRIARRMGHSNPFVTGEKQWTLGHRNSGEGLSRSGGAVPQQRSAATVDRATAVETTPTTVQMIRGNRNSRVYHLVGCPSYGAVAKHNIIEFYSEAEALAAGFRKAGNCR